MILTRSKLDIIFGAIGVLARQPGKAKGGLAQICNDALMAGSPIPSVLASEVLGQDISVNLYDFLPVDGNVSLDELTFISALSRKIQPRVAVEIGTFDGNTTLQIALNTPPESRIFTLDLPAGGEGSAANDPKDKKFIGSSHRIRRRFIGSSVEHKITQCYGDSLTYNFAEFTVHGKSQLIFIDAGHSYECVRSDSEKALAILAKGGTIVWQDYSVRWEGVFRYLCELSRTLSMVHIAGTSLVIYRSIS
jgi:predicted O-methyltransferase YrrM